MQLQKQSRLLPEPVIHSYNQEGVGDVDVADPSKPLEVLVGPVDLSQRDRIDLYWGANDAVIDTYVHSPDAPDTNGIVSLYVNTRWIESGLTDVRYIYTRFPAGNPEPSPVKQVIVKLEIPGGRDPDPATPYENEKLDLPVVSPPGVITSPEGVSVTLKPWENMVEGDVPSVFWHGIRIQLPPLTLPQIGRPLVVPIDKEVIIEAGDSENIVVRYEIRDVVNNWSKFSLPTYVEVEAGTSTLPAPVAPQAPEMVLDLDKLAGADIQALVLTHPDIAIGDTLTFVSERSTAEGIELPPYSASKIVERPGSFVEFVIPHAQFVPITQGRARFKYSVTKASGQRLRSKSLPLSILGQPQRLAPPVIPAAVDGVLDPTLHAVVTQVPPYHFMKAGDDVTLVWMGRTSMGSTVMHEETKRLSSADIGKVVDYVIPDEKLRVLAGGSVEVYYTVLTSTKAFFKSPVLRLRVGPDNLSPLPRPRIKEANGDTLDPINTPSGATVIIEANANLRAGDRVYTIWNGPKENGYKDQIVTEPQAGKALEVVFAPSLVSNNVGQVVKVVYAVYRLNGPMQRSEEIRVRIVDSFRFDTSPVTLAGKVYLLPATPDLLPQLPPGTSVRRTATGGQAPYSYTSSDQRVANVDSDGLTTVRGNGKALITATDASGAALSFEVTVTGVVHCIGVGQGKYSAMSAAAAGIGGRLPDINELKALYAAYGSRWPMGNGNYWSSTVAAQNLVGMKWYYVKNLVTGLDFKLMEHSASLCVALR